MGIQLVEVTDRNGQPVAGVSQVSPPEGCFCLKIRRGTKESDPAQVVILVGGNSADDWKTIVPGVLNVKFVAHMRSRASYMFEEMQGEECTAMLGGRWVTGGEDLLAYMQDI